MNKYVNILMVSIALTLQPVVAEIIKSFKLKRPVERVSVIQGFAGTGKSECLKMIKIKLESQRSKMTCLGLWDMNEDTGCSPEEFIQSIKDKTKDISGKKVVLLDNVDAWMRTLNRQPEVTSFDKWEKELVRPLLYQSKDIFIVVTTSRQLFWNDPDVTSNIQLHELSSPTLEQMKSKATSGLSKKIEKTYSLTFGYVWAMAQLKSKPELSASDIAKATTIFVKQQIAEDISNILSEIAITPLLNIPLLRRLVKVGSSEITHGKAVELLDSLLKCGLLTPLSDISAYRFTDGGIRRLLMREFRNSNPEDFFQKHEQAEAYFQTQSRYVGSLHRSIVGALYHTTILGNRSGDPLIKCQEWIAQNNDNLEGADRRRVLEAWTTSDYDPHLKEELVEILGEEGFKIVTKSLEIALG